MAIMMPTRPMPPMPMAPPRPMGMPPAGPLPGGPPMGGPPMGAPPPMGGTAPFEPPMNPQALQRMALLHMLQQAPKTDPNGGLPVGTTMPKAYAPPTSESGRGRY